MNIRVLHHSINLNQQCSTRGFFLSRQLRNLESSLLSSILFGLIWLIASNRYMYLCMQGKQKGRRISFSFLCAAIALLGHSALLSLKLGGSSRSACLHSVSCTCLARSSGCRWFLGWSSWQLPVLLFIIGLLLIFYTWYSLLFLLRVGLEKSVCYCWHIYLTTLSFCAFCLFAMFVPESWKAVRMALSWLFFGSLLDL